MDTAGRPAKSWACRPSAGRTLAELYALAAGAEVAERAPVGFGA